MRKLAFFLVIVGALIIATYLSAKAYLPSYVREQLLERVNGACASCHLDLGSVDVDFFPGSITLHDLRVDAGHEERTKIDCTIRTLKVDIPLRDMISKIPHNKFILGDIHVIAPVFTVVDGDAPRAKTPRKESARPVFSTTGLEVRSGTFIYVRIYKNVRAKLIIHDVDGSIGPIGTTPDLINASTHAHTGARYEKSGHLNVDIKAFVFARPLNVDVDVKVSQQNLEDLTTFFNKNDGIELKGKLVAGAGEVRVRGDELTSRVFAKYEGFDLKFNKTAERSPLLGYLMGVGAQVLMDRQNKHEALENQIRQVDLKREPGQSLVSFILEGLKQGAIKVASAPKAKK